MAVLRGFMFWAEACCTVINTGADDLAPRLSTASEGAGGVPRVLSTPVKFDPAIANLA